MSKKQVIDTLCEPSLDEKMIKLTLTSDQPIDALAMLDSLAHFIQVFCRDNGIDIEDSALVEEESDSSVPNESKH